MAGVSQPPDVDAVHAANLAFYAAFESRDLDALAAVWEHSDRVTVVHPGWPILRGWGRVLASFEAICANTAFMQFVLTDERVTVEGGTAWVTCEENLLQSISSREGANDLGELSGARVIATNVFVRHADGWRMVHHQGSPAPTGMPDEGDPV